MYIYIYLSILYIYSVYIYISIYLIYIYIYLIYIYIYMYILYIYISGWWFGTMGFYDFPLGIIIPTDELIFFRGGETTNQIYIYISISTGSRYLPLGYLLIQAFLHVQILHPLQHFVLSVKMKVAFRCVFGTRMFVLYWHSQVFVLDSPSSKVVFFICSPRSFQVT